MPLETREADELRRKIDARHAALEDEIREDSRRVRQDNTSDLVGGAPDPGDASVADLIADIEGAEMERDSQELRELDGALARMADGTYGECADCGRDIGFARLMAQPAALRCVQCQERFERLHVTPGAPTL